jgi:hypothetical protein
MLQVESEALLLCEQGSAAAAAASSACSSSSGGGGGSSAGCSSPAVQQLLQSEQLLRLLVATQALHAQVLQETACGLLGGSGGEGSRRAAAVEGSSPVAATAAAAAAAVAAAAAAPAAAEGVLRALDLGWTSSVISMFSGWEEAAVAEYMTNSIIDTAQVLMRMLSSNMQQHQRQQQLAVSVASLLQPWALLQLQLVQLVSDLHLKWQGKFYCVKVLNQLLDAAEHLLDAAARAAFKRNLLQPVLLLLPHISEVPASSSRGAASSSSSRTAAQPDEYDFKQLQLSYACLLMKVQHEGEHPVFSHIYYQTCVRLHCAPS